MPRVTVLMAMFNGRPFLSEAIDSVLSQVECDFELLIVDDGSTDGSRELVLARGDPRIRLLENRRNLGLSPSLNRGLRHARGEYVARQDADDVSEPQRLSRQVAFLDAHPDVALIGSWYREINADGAETGRVQLPCDAEAIHWALWFYCPFAHSAVMFRRSIVPETVGPYAETLRYSMDYELWRRVARRFPVANLGEYLVRIRTNPGSMTATYGEATQEGERMRVAAIAERLGWDRADEVGNTTRFASIQALFFGSGFRPARELERAAGDLDRLAKEFARAEAPGPRRHELLSRLRKQLGTSLSEALWRHRELYSAGDFVRLLWLACRIHPAIVFERRGFGPLARRLASGLAKALSGGAGGRGSRETVSVGITRRGEETAGPPEDLRGSSGK